MKIEILNRWTLKVIFECEADSMKVAVELAIKQRTYLRDAYLSDADLRGADLRDADLRGADLSGADLRGAYLRDADLSDAYLRDAYLSDADLRGADLRGADLRGADLSGADLRGAYLRDADLLPIKADFIEVISQAPREVPALIDALKAGRVDGSTYSGECACLVGTIANARGIDVDSAELGIPKDSSRPVERFFMAIRKGDTPETNAASKLALEWAETWLDTQRKAFAS
ncbi:pentapeptide repeat-containing protein [Burkholderia cenocepacia]|jgi:hypothetical protein|uniref:pentapeptide repeat-containing protein n=1 Tax=Burkholderia cenocepacia TaxID=95486 RepID=UPI002ABD678B|nr:pentapeptide repeat-containing protein [Burkholderia cenocepacia]